MIDLTVLQTRYTGRSYELQCPACGHWCASLVILDTWELICRACLRAVEERIGGTDEMTTENETASEKLEDNTSPEELEIESKLLGLAGLV